MRRTSPIISRGKSSNLQASYPPATNNIVSSPSLCVVEFLTVPHLRPGLAEIGLDIFRRVVVVCEAHFVGIPLEFAVKTRGDGRKQNPFGKRARNAEV